MILVGIIWIAALLLAVCFFLVLAFRAQEREIAQAYKEIDELELQTDTLNARLMELQAYVTDLEAWPVCTCRQGCIARKANT